MVQPAARLFRPSGARLAVGLALAVAAGTGCTSWNAFSQNSRHYFNSNYEDTQAQEKMAEAEKLAQDGQLDAAKDRFKILADNKSNPVALAERARYMQAECRRLLKDYPGACATYNRLLQDFPTGTYRQLACTRMFEIADYWLDDFRAELDARKDEKGVLVKQISFPNVTDQTKPTFSEEDRALEALEHIHTHDITGPSADQALFWCGYVNYIRGNFNEADHFFSQLILLHKDSKYRPLAIAMAIQSKNNSTGGEVYDGRKCAEALKLVHQAKATEPEMTQNPEMAAKLAKAELAIRAQQAEKLLRTAEYYERTKHPGSAYFYYELLRRQHAGTRFSDLATARMEKLKADLDRKKTSADRQGTWGAIQGKWSEMFGKEQPLQDKAAPPPTTTAASPTPPAPPSPQLPDPRLLPVGLSNPKP